MACSRQRMLILVLMLTIEFGHRKHYSILHWTNIQASYHFWSSWIMNHSLTQKQPSPFLWKPSIARALCLLVSLLSQWE